MNINQEAFAIKYLFESEPKRTFRAGDIAKILGLRGKQLKRLQGVLQDLTRAGEVNQVKPGLYQLAELSATVSGRLTVLRSGAGYVTQKESGATVWIPREEMENALPGDTVTVRLTHSAADEPRGKIANIAQRAARDIVGTLTIRGAESFVTPLDPAYHREFTVPATMGGRDGDRVVIRLASWDDTNRPPQGEIVDVIGPADKPSLDTAVVSRQYDLPGDFPPAAIKEAEKVSARLNAPGKRLDLRDQFIFTIDPAKARDFDDALSFAIDEQGNRVLGVHIADVSHFVRPGSALDNEAYERGTSVYLVDKVIPMLPEQLSNGVCSLRPDEDRLALSAFLTFDNNGRRVAHRFAKTIIRSSLRLTYEQTMAIIDGHAPQGLDKPLPAAVSLIIPAVNTLAQQLRQLRMNAGALNLEVPECEVLLDGEGRMTSINITPTDFSHQMIEECMVAANEAVATELSSRGIAILARLHEPPAPEKLEELQAALAVLGFKPGDLSSPKRLAAFIASTADHPLKHHAHTLVLRSMKRAIYSAAEAGHFGLAKRYYSHFTSPIRRYPDLTLHRQLANYLIRGQADGKFDKGYLTAVAEHSTEMEQRADDAARALIEIKKYRFLQQQIDDRKPITYDATVSRVSSFGIFIDVTALQLTAMVHISLLGDQYFHFNRAKETLSAGSTTFRVGTKVRAHVATVDFAQRRADFKLVTDEAAPKETQTADGKKTARPKREANAGERKAKSATNSAKSVMRNAKSSAHNAHPGPRAAKSGAHNTKSGARRKKRSPGASI